MAMHQKAKQTCRGDLSDPDTGGNICIEGHLKAGYYLYRHTENILDLTALEAPLR